VGGLQALRKLVAPKLLAVGWDTDPHSIAEQRTITDGRIVPVGKGFVRKSPKRVDFLLRYTRDFPLAVVEVKADYKAATDGIQQAKIYAEMLGLKFAMRRTDTRSSLAILPPLKLWARYRQANGISDPAQADRLLTPFNQAVGKGERYYQQIAINRAVEGALKGGRRHAAHHGDGHRQDRGCLPDMLEAVECTLETALASTVARASSILPTATSSSISQRMASSRCKSDSPSRAGE
jgi:type I site-specific restriction endonuclease